jgi:hypothetical protein
MIFFGMSFIAVVLDLLNLFLDLKESEINSDWQNKTFTCLAKLVSVFRKGEENIFQKTLQFQLL